MPTEADLAAAEQKQAEARVPSPTEQLPLPNRKIESRRHLLPDAPQAAWKISATAFRGLLSLGLAAAAGALVMVVVGWPRGSSVTPEVDARGRVSNVLTEPSASMASERVVIDVDGNVERPGVVELPQGSRIIDAIRAAGGLTGRSDTGELNLAEVLIDGQQVVVPSRGSDGSTPLEGSGGVASGSTSAPSAGTTVSVNSASATELETLPGIGPVLAAAIVDWRTQNGGFTSIEQLQEVSGIGPTTYAELAPLVRL